MNDRPNIHATNLLWAGKRYGDACLARDLAMRSWVRGAPRDDINATCREAKDAWEQLQRAARSYATRMRRLTRKASVQVTRERDAG